MYSSVAKRVLRHVRLTDRLTMKFSSLLTACICASSLAASPAVAQTTYFAEDFNAGVVPPAGWTQVNNNGDATIGWIPDAAGRAWHQDEAGVISDMTLVSPVIDLSSATGVFLHFDGETNYAQYLVNHPNSIGDGISNMEITTDGGASWTVVWTDTSQNSYDTYSPSIDLSAYAGNANVQIGIHLYGTFDQEWWVDNVLVDDQAVPVITSITNPNNGHPYFLLGQADFATAHAKALELGGSLVTIDSVQENNWIRANFSNFGGTSRNLMLGLNDVTLEGTFEWVSGEALTYTNWAVGEPNNGAGGEDYVQMVPGGLWNDFDGNGSHAIIEISEASIATTPLVAGQIATISVSGLRVGSNVIMVFSTNGAGPTNTPYGVLDVDPDMISPLFPAISGQFNFSTYIPSALSGSTLFGQAIQFNADSSTDLSAAFSKAIQ